MIPVEQIKPPSARPLRALIEITGGELRVYPVADNDGDERRILDALRFIAETDGNR